MFLKHEPLATTCVQEIRKKMRQSQQRHLCTPFLHHQVAAANANAKRYIPSQEENEQKQFNVYVLLLPLLLNKESCFEKNKVCNMWRGGSEDVDRVFTCGAADRSRQGKCCSCCCCCCWGDHFSYHCLLMYTQKGCEKNKTFARKRCEKNKTFAEREV